MKSDINQYPDLLRISDVCRLLNYSRSTIINWEREGILKPTFRVNRGKIQGHRRYKKEDVMKFLEKR